MKRILSTFLVITVVLLSVLICTPLGYASTKKEEARTIAIVFDNSGSMYDEGDQAWCRATYAMEVFASMLNKGDTLLSYPMNPITVEGNTYTMQSPFKITDVTQSELIRSIYTEEAKGTPIESIDCAIADLQGVKDKNKYLIVLTDGGTFYQNGGELSKASTKWALDQRIQAQAGENMTVMFSRM